MPAVAGMVHHYLGRHRSTPDTPGPNSSKQTPCRAASFLGHSNFKPDQAGRHEIGGAFVSCGMLDAEFARAARGERPSPDDTILLPPDMPLLSPVGARREEPPMRRCNSRRFSKAAAPSCSSGASNGIAHSLSSSFAGEAGDADVAGPVPRSFAVDSTASDTARVCGS